MSTAPPLGRRDRENRTMYVALRSRLLSYTEPAHRLGAQHAGLSRIPHRSTDHGAEIPRDGGEALPLLPVPLWNRDLFSQHSVPDLQIARRLLARYAVAGGAGPRL